MCSRVKDATDALSDPEDYVTGDNLGLEELFAEMTDGGLQQRPQTQELNFVDEAIPDVLNDDDHDLCQDYMDINDTKRETTRTRGVYFP